MLPDVDGWRIVRALRDAESSTPVLFLTARDSVEDRVKGLELGADDYLVKPFAFSELLARVRTLLRRGSAPVSQDRLRSEEHTSELQSLMRISYAVFCLKKKISNKLNILY